MRGVISRPVKTSMLSGATLDKRANAVRAENLKLLLARAYTDQVPTVAGFARKLLSAGALVTESAIRNSICGKTPLPSEMAKEIEVVMELPAGWMDVDHSFVFGTSSGPALEGVAAVAAQTVAHAAVAETIS